MTIDAHPDALAALPPGYHALFDRVLAATRDDQRIRGLWLSGSLARGTADPGSDLDLVLAVADDDFAGFVAGWRDWLAGIAPILVADQVPRTELIFYALTESMHRLDGVVEPVSRVPESSHRTRVPVIDRDGLNALVPEPAPGRPPDPVKITAIVTEFWRQQAILPAMLDGRNDLLCAMVGMQHATTMLYDVFVEANQPLPPMGVKQYSSRLNPDQRGVLLALPAAGPDRAELVRASRAVRVAMSTAGRAAAVRAGAVYPDWVADAVSAHLDEVLF